MTLIYKKNIHFLGGELAYDLISLIIKIGGLLL